MKSIYQRAEAQIVVLSNDDVVRTSSIRLDQGEYGRADELEEFLS